MSPATLQEKWTYEEFEKALKQYVEDNVGEYEEEQFLTPNENGESLHDVTIEAQWQEDWTTIEDAAKAHLENMRGHVANSEASN